MMGLHLAQVTCFRWLINTIHCHLSITEGLHLVWVSSNEIHDYSTDYYDYTGHYTCGTSMNGGRDCGSAFPISPWSHIPLQYSHFWNSMPKCTMQGKDNFQKLEIRGMNEPWNGVVPSPHSSVNSNQEWYMNFCESNNCLTQPIYYNTSHDYPENYSYNWNYMHGVYMGRRRGRGLRGHSFTESSPSQGPSCSSCLLSYITTQHLKDEVKDRPSIPRAVSPKRTRLKAWGGLDFSFLLFPLIHFLSNCITMGGTSVLVLEGQIWIGCYSSHSLDLGWIVRDHNQRARPICRWDNAVHPKLALLSRFIPWTLWTTAYM